MGGNLLSNGLTFLNQTRFFVKTKKTSHLAKMPRASFSTFRIERETPSWPPGRVTGDCQKTGVGDDFPSLLSNPVENK
jgi:hypothetical protein